MFENWGRHLQSHRFDACLSTATLFSLCITDTLVLLLPTQLAASTANTTRYCCHISPNKLGLLMTEEGDNRFWAFLEQVTALLLTCLWDAVLLPHYWQHRNLSPRSSPQCQGCCSRRCIPSHCTTVSFPSTADAIILIFLCQRKKGK